MRAGKLSEVARHVVLPDGIVSTGWPAVRDTCHRLGLTFDEWQDGAGRAILAKRSDGLYAADTVVISIPRQVGKTFLIAAIAFALCVIQPGTTVIWTAHRFKTARETFMSLKGMALGKPMLAHVDPALVMSGSGNESIGFRNGSRIMFGARERGFGRGFSSVDVLVLDEAQILSATAMEDMVPTTNAAPNPLILLTGTPPRPVDPGEVFTSARMEALSGESEGVLYIEFSADPDADISDREQWAKANPSYPERTNARAILRMRKNLTPESFMREGLGVWDLFDLTRFAPIPIGLWDACASSVTKPDIADPMFCLTVAKGLAAASIAVAVPVDGRPHVELADHRAGVHWLGERVRKLAERYPEASFAAYAAGPVKSWVPSLAEHGIELRLLTQPEASSACAHLQKLADVQAFTHAHDETLTASLRGARKRDLDGGGWVWDWKTSDGDLAPIVAATGALWLLESAEQPPALHEWPDEATIRAWEDEHARSPL
jgi:hypothetical protein